jgi:hypothetical protein
MDSNCVSFIGRWKFCRMCGEGTIGQFRFELTEKLILNFFERIVIDSKSEIE